ncbi:acyl carrier protein [Streptomyces sp. NPDC040724]|uniref:acyl carrier protein n=1 Tax=Streptomyces sp. NPDC040724 TaxID=3155612 RepID=UPI0033D57EAF
MTTQHTADAPTAAVVTGELQEFLAKHLGRDVAPDEDYFALGLVNSLFAMALVGFVEQRYGFEVDVDDLDLGHFSTVDNLTRFVLAKTAAREAAA